MAKVKVNGAKRGRGRPPKAATLRKRKAVHSQKMRALQVILALPVAERSMVIGAVQALTK